MTAARLLAAPSEGHGLTDKQTDELYHLLVDGKPTRPVLALVLLDPVATAQRKTAKGLHRSVTFEAARVEPILDSNQAGELMWLLQKLYEQRTSTGDQRMLPLGGLGGDVEEKRQAAMERMEDWADEQGLLAGGLESQWRQHFGIDPDKDFSYGDHGVPGDYRKAGLQQLLEFTFQHVDRHDAGEDDEDAADEGVDDAESADGDDAAALHVVEDDADGTEVDGKRRAAGD